jgi:hypothetical protein
MARGPYFEAEALMAEARRIAGADDWGDEDFREPFEALVAAINAEAELTPQGLARTKSYILRRLVGRLRLYQDRKTYPGIAQEEIRKPLFVTGLGRSGTSYLNALLATDPSSHAPLHWQIWTLSPPPNHPDTDNAPQIEAGEHLIQFEGWQDEAMRDKHDFSATNAAEDTLIQDYAFVANSAVSFWNVPSFGAWLAKADFSATYRFERKVLQALQFGDKRDRWVLKSPLHLRQLSYLFGEFPDAQVVVNHRDPVKSLASSASFIVALKKQFGNAQAPPDRNQALAMMESSAQSLEALISRRADPKVDEVFVDVNYMDLESNPLGQVAKVYDHFGIEFTDVARRNMQDHIDNNRKGKFGAHRYDITDSGLRVEEVRERFKFYTDYFDIPYEVKS